MRTPRPLVFAALALAAGAAAVAVVPAGSAGSRATGTGTPVQSMPELAGVNFVSACGFSHRLPDDPIVAPRRPGASHDHSFVGNTTTNARSTLGSLLRGSTTCHRPGDTAAYWMPTLLVDGMPLAPAAAQIYYRRRTLDPVRAFPRNLRVVAGDARAGRPQAPRVTFWSCGVETGIPRSSTPPACPDARRGSLRLHVTFPDCWDGRNLDSADHASHMAYSLRGRCPATHPVAVPAISLVYRYASPGGPAVALASGGVYSAHADFVNAWDQRALEALVDACLNALRHCGRGS